MTKYSASFTAFTNQTFDDKQISFAAPNPRTLFRRDFAKHLHTDAASLGVIERGRERILRGLLRSGLCPLEKGEKESLSLAQILNVLLSAIALCAFALVCLALETLMAQMSSVRYYSWV